MNLDELQSVQARERQSSDLQHLRSSFYREVGEYIHGLTVKRAEAVDRADDPFSSQEVRKLTDDIETAEQTVEAIYERRVGKVVKKASIAAAGMPVDDDGLTTEEAALFEALVERIEENRETVLSVLDGDAPSVSCSIDGSESDDDGRYQPRDPDVEPAGSDLDPEVSDGVSAADLMGGDSDGDIESSSAGASGTPTATDAPPVPEAPEATPSERTPETDESAELSPSASGQDSSALEDAASSKRRPGSDADPGMDATSDDGTSTDERGGPGGDDASARDAPEIPRTTVRITADVGEVVGVDNRDYDLGTEDVVTLPEPNAEVLVEKDAAERLP